MQTPSHFIISAALLGPLRKTALPFHSAAFLIGSILPDIAFMVLTVAYEIYYRVTQLPVPAASIMEYLHFQLFYIDPLWIISHNFFHSLIINGLLLGVGFGARHRWRRAGPFIFWLAAAMLFHTLIDIATHHSDGPLFLMPLSMTYRWASPISYWETAYHARTFMVFEYGLDAILVFVLIRHWRRNRHKPGQRPLSQAGPMP